MIGHLKRATAEGQPAPTAQPPAQTAPPRRRGPVRRLYTLVRSILALGMLAIVLLIVTPIPEKLYEWLDVTSPPAKSDYIVCLGGDPARLIWAVEAYRHGYAPRIIVTNKPEAVAWMKDRLVECGIPKSAIDIDSASSTTADHPAAIAQLPGIDPARQRFMLVTDYEHSRRAAACFRHGGYVHVSVYGAGFHLRQNPEPIKSWRWRIMELPTLLYEYAALTQYWLQGRI